MKDDCIHMPVCKFKDQEQEDMCDSQAICKFYNNGEVVRSHDREVIRKHTVVKRHYKKRATKPVSDDDIEAIPESGEAITEKAFRKARARLDRLQRAGKLDENQIKALEAYKGKHFSTLEEVQKQQIVNMARGK